MARYAELDRGRVMRVVESERDLSISPNFVTVPDDFPQDVGERGNHWSYDHKTEKFYRTESRKSVTSNIKDQLRTAIQNLVVVEVMAGQFKGTAFINYRKDWRDYIKALVIAIRTENFIGLPKRPRPVIDVLIDKIVKLED